MIASRTHAGIDLGLTAALTAVALSPAASVRVRWIAAAAAAYQAGYSALTDYEGGVSPRFRLQEHRVFELVGAGLLGVAGWALESRVLLGAGAANLALATVSDAHAHAGAPEMSYLPLDVPKRLARDVWIVDSALGPGLPVRMTAIRLQNGSLLLHSPTRFSPGLRQALEGIGPICYLVAPNVVHWMFVKAWQDAVPAAVTLAAPGLRERGPVRRAGLRIDQELRERAPEAWAGEIEQVVVPGGGGFTEVAMFHRPSSTLLMTDLMQNFEPGKLPWMLRPIARLLGNVAPLSRAPAHLRAVVLWQRRRAREAARRIVAWAPERILVTHGRPIERDAAARLRRSLAWLTAG